MRIEQLEYFIKVAETASINKASERLYITQQSLNVALTKLEQELGVILFERHSQGVTLTAEGHEVFNYAIDIIEKTDALKEKISPISEENHVGLRGILDLSICPPVSHWVIPNFLKKFHLENKDIHLSMIECENMEMIYSLLDNSERICIMNVYERFDREFELLNLQKLFFRELCESKTCAVVSERHPLAKRKSISSSVLRQYPLAIFQAAERTSNSVEEYLNTFGETKVVFKTNNLTAYQEFLDAGDAIGFMGRCFNKKFFDFREDMKLIPIKDFPKTRIVCLTNLSYYNKKKPLIEMFLEYLRIYLN
ncbi:MAG: LysR family transcriptional regulator [Peptococcaceae bacterium]|nr:LysR family transcriptional regulator [Peptococcaceae bacterium]